MKALILASLAALVVEPIVFFLFCILSGDSFGPSIAGTVFAVMAVAAAHLVVIGLPLFYLLWRSNRLSLLTVSLAGFFAGLIVVAVHGWPINNIPGSLGGTWHGQYREFIVDGVPTMFGWLLYVEGLVFYGLHGFLGALVFYYVWRRLRPNNSFNPKPLRGSG